jgi:urease accessory protein
LSAPAGGSALAALLMLADSRLPAGGHAHSGGAEEACALGLILDEHSLETFLARRLTTAGRVAASLAAAACRAAAPGRPGTPPAAPLAGRDAPDPDRATPFQGVWGAEPSAGVWGGALPGWSGGAPRQVRTQRNPEHQNETAGRTELEDLDAEAEARVPSPALRKASRVQGRGLVRVGRLAWPDPAWDGLPLAPHHPLAIGIAAYAAGLDARAAAVAAAYLAISGPATAAQRLLGMDPMKVAAATARLAGAVDAEADRASLETGAPAACTDPLLDLLAERHATRTERYFAS